MRTAVAIVGGGPGGATSALFLAEQGISSVIINIFAGRLWGRQPSTAVMEPRRLLKRERVYGADDEYSVPKLSSGTRGDLGSGTGVGVARAAFISAFSRPEQPHLRR
jgi:flavin-dependent dehydrogenase